MGTGPMRRRLWAALATGALVLTPALVHADVTSSAVAGPRVPAGEVITVGDAVLNPSAPPLRRQPFGRAAAPVTYDLRFFTMGRPDATVDYNEAELRDLAARTDAWYSRVTGGVIRLRFAGWEQLPSLPDRVCGIREPERILNDRVPFTPTVGATDVIWVAITPWLPREECELGGQANFGAPGVWMKDSEGLRVLTHEIGHNLGLLHSATADERFPWPADLARVDYTEYGDTTDTMGIGGFWSFGAVANFWNQADMHAHHLNMLGLLPESAIGSASGSGPTVMTLRKVNGTGLRAIYVPMFNRSKVVLDFRPVSYMNKRVNSWQGPKAGVYVRLVNSGDDTGPAPYVFPADTVALSYSYGEVDNIGFGAKRSVRLPDGTVVAVLSVTATAATVRITRPADTVPPTIDTSAWGCAGDACLLDGREVLWDERGPVYDLVDVVTDAVWVSDLQVTVDGTQVDLPPRPTPGTQTSQAVRLPLPSPGAHTLSIEAVDSSGNRTTRDISVNVALDPPVNGWFTRPGLSLGWLSQSEIDCSVTDFHCVGLVARATQDCPGGVTATILVKSGERVADRIVRRSAPVRAGEMVTLIATTRYTGSFQWNLESVSCG